MTLNNLTYEEFSLGNASVPVDPRELYPLFQLLRKKYTVEDVKTILSNTTPDSKGAPYIAIVRIGKELVAFSVFYVSVREKFIVIQFIYASVKTKYGSKGIYSFLTQERFRTHNPDFLVGRPHNPYIYKGLQKLSQKIYPSIMGKLSSTERTFYKSFISSYFLSEDRDYNAETSVLRNVFAPEDMFERPLSNCEATNRYFAEHVGMNDALFVLVDVRKPKYDS